MKQKLPKEEFEEKKQSKNFLLRELQEQEAELEYNEWLRGLITGDPECQE